LKFAARSLFICKKFLLLMFVIPVMLDLKEI
jgi:hypothetical protein